MAFVFTNARFCLFPKRFFTCPQKMCNAPAYVYWPCKMCNAPTKCVMPPGALHVLWGHYTSFFIWLRGHYTFSGGITHLPGALHILRGHYTFCKFPWEYSAWNYRLDSRKCPKTILNSVHCSKSRFSIVPHLMHYSAPSHSEHCYEWLGALLWNKTRSTVMN